VLQYIELKNMKKIIQTIYYVAFVGMALLVLTNGVNALTYEGTIGSGNGGAVGTPNTPTGLSATIQSTTQINLSWDAVSNADGYELYKGDSLLTTTSDTSYSNTGLSANTAYSYKIRSYIGSVYSDFSTVVFATTEAESVSTPDPPANPGSGNTGGGGGDTTPSIPSTVTSTNTALTVSPTQTGTVNYNFADLSSAKVVVPTGAVNSNTTFSVAQGTLTSAQTPLETTGAFMVGNKVFNITAVNTSGTAVTSFAQNLTITFSVPDMPADVADLAVYYFNNTTKEWVKVSGAVFNPTDKTLVFSVNHLTTFVIFKVNDTPDTLSTANTTQPVTEPEGQVLGEKLTANLGTNIADYVANQKKLLKAIDKNLTKRLAGRILLQVQDHGEAWYLDKISSQRYYLSNGANAYGALRKFGLGITNKDLAKIPVGIEKRFLDTDTDGDGLADKLEEGLGTDINKKDTDGDGVSDYEEIINQATNPSGTGKIAYNTALINRIKGRIVLQVESKGEAWYISPVDGRRYYMKDGDAAYQIMRFLSLGITNDNICKIEIGDL